MFIVPDRTFQTQISENHYRGTSFLQTPSTTLESSVSREWEAANAEKDDIKRSKQIAELLNKIPKGNKKNIEFLLDFLARLNGEEGFCHEDTVSVLLLKKAHASRVPLIASRARRKWRI